MPLTKLTLSVAPGTVREAKRSAATRHTSVSSLFARLVRAMAVSRTPDLRTSPITRRASGLLRLPGKVSDADLLADALESRHRGRG
jgi:hypothetical protein